MDAENAIVFDLSDIPKPNLEAMQRRAVHEGKPLQMVIKELLLENPKQLTRRLKPYHNAQPRPRSKSRA